MDVVICRCEGITEEAIRGAMREWGAASPNEVKLVTRAGKGLCQGRCCRDLVERIVSHETGKAPGQLPPPSVRPPVRAVPVTAAGPAPDTDGRLSVNVLTLQTANEEATIY